MLWFISLLYRLSLFSYYDLYSYECHTSIHFWCSAVADFYNRVIKMHVCSLESKPQWLMACLYHVVCEPMASQLQSWIKPSLCCPSLCGQWLFLAWPLHVVQPLRFLLFPLPCTTLSSPKSWSNQVTFSPDFLLFHSGTSDSSQISSLFSFVHYFCLGLKEYSESPRMERVSRAAYAKSITSELRRVQEKNRWRRDPVEECGVVWYGLDCLAGCPSGTEDFSLPRWSLAQRSGHIQQLNRICLRPKLHSHHWSAFTRRLLGRNSALIWAY